MIRNLMITLAFCLCAATLFAQKNHSVKGIIIDKTEKNALQNVTVTILSARDSMLQAFSYTLADGSFAVNKLDTGSYLLLVSLHSYADYIAPFMLNAQSPDHDLGSISITLKAKLLQEVMINGGVTAIKLKGDTTEFNAKAYVIQPNDKVEDLLRQLPGIQVDNNGRITAQGQVINKVLVDGEEFFSDDPLLVTRNIRADMVSKVQLFDKKSDQATFSGIDDGKKTKTINIVLKEDKRKGTFGKVDAGQGTNNYYQLQAIANRFNKDEKFSAYGTVANTGRLGLGFIDNNRLGSGNLDIPDDGVVPLPTNGDLDASTGVYDGRGNPVARSAGAHYDNKWADKKQSINTNYKIGSLDVSGINTTDVLQSLPAGSINTNTFQTFKNYVSRQKADVTYQLAIDTSANIKFYVDGTSKSIRNAGDYYTVNKDGNNALLNNEARSNSSEGTQQIFNANVFLTKKFSKPRRTLSWNFVFSHNKGNTNEQLKSAINFYDNAGSVSSSQITDQYKDVEIANEVLSSNIAYTEPLSKSFSLMFNYALGINNNDSRRETFNQSATGHYDVLDPRFSNHYKFNQLYNQAGAIINYKSNKAVLNFGTRISLVDFKQTNVYAGDVTNRDFLNWAPQVRYQYSFSKSLTLAASYNGSNTQPTVDQIQPVTINNTPLVLTVGNPDLKPYYTNYFSVTFRGNKPLGGPYFYISPSYSIISDQVVDDVTTDAKGKTVLTYRNLGGRSAYNYYLFVNYGRSIKAITASMDISMTAGGNISYSYSNGLLNTSNNREYSARIGLSKSKQKKYVLGANFSPNYTVSSFSLTPQINNNAAGFSTGGNGTLYLPGKTQVSANINYRYKAKTEILPEQRVTQLNAALSKTFFKGDNLKLSLSVNDILNQNVNINRAVSGNSITQSSLSAIRRYFMFSISWDFTKFGTTATNE
nr:outer membrane beta-barrel family protein [uncultured Mucilaginibacter sp.]